LPLVPGRLPSGRRRWRTDQSNARFRATVRAEAFGFSEYFPETACDRFNGSAPKHCFTVSISQRLFGLI
jgi:hypothetical protein